MKKALKTKRFTLRQELQEARLSTNLNSVEVERLERELRSLTSRVDILEAMLKESKTQIMGEAKTE